MDIAELIAANKRGRSYRTLATDCGGRPTHGRIQQLATGTAEWMEPDNIRGLATGLGVSERAVVLALAESLGLRVEASHRLELYLPGDTSSLTPKQLSAIGELVRSMVEPGTSEEESNDGRQPEAQKIVEEAERILREATEPTPVTDDAALRVAHSITHKALTREQEMEAYELLYSYGRQLGMRNDESERGAVSMEWIGTLVDWIRARRSKTFVPPEVATGAIPFEALPPTRKVPSPRSPQGSPAKHPRR